MDEAEARETWVQAVCTGCECLCDDIQLKVASNSVSESKNLCEKGEQWLGQLQAKKTVSPDVDFDRLIKAAADLMRSAQSPLIWGLRGVSVQSARESVAIADKSRAFIDSLSSNSHRANVEALQSVGKVTCSLGEVKNRADLIVYWRADPAASQPRHFEGFDTNASAQETLGSSLDENPGRKIIVVDSEKTATAEKADDFIQLNPDQDLAALEILRCLVGGISIKEEFTLKVTGQPLEVWKSLFNDLTQAKYSAFFWGGSRGGGSKGGGSRHSACSLASFQLVRDMNQHSRCVLLPMGDESTITAEEVLCWQTGFPMAVNFGFGYPTYGPQEFDAVKLLAQDGCDLVVMVGDFDYQIMAMEQERDDQWRRALDSLRKMAKILITDQEATDERNSVLGSVDIEIPVSNLGLYEDGSVFRSDGFCMPIKQILQSDAPQLSTVLSRIHAAL